METNETLEPHIDENGPAIQKVPQFGFGPWYVFLAFNIVPKPKKKTLILVHSSPEWVLQIKNFGEAGTSLWRSVVIIGPFEVDKHARVFKDLWERGPRPRHERLLWGIVMCYNYKTTHNIRVWFRKNDGLMLGVSEVERLQNEKKKRQRVRRGRRGKPGERMQRIYELVTPEEREKTLGATKVRREIRDMRKKDGM